MSRTRTLSPGSMLAIALLAFVGIGSTPAAAGTIEVELHANVTAVNSAFEDGLPVVIGEGVVIRFQYDPSVAAVDPSGEPVLFLNALLGLSLDFAQSGYSFVFGSGNVSTNDDRVIFNDLLDTVALTSVIPTDAQVPGIGELTSVTVLLDQTVPGAGPAPTLVVDGRLGPLPLPLGALNALFLNGSTDQDAPINDRISLVASDTPVPEPAAAMLLLLAAALIGLPGALRP